MDYTEQPQVEAYLKRQLTDDEETMLEFLIPTVKEYIDRVTGRVFVIDENDTVRYYDGGKQELFIDPLMSLTSIQSIDQTNTVQDTYVVDEDYYTMPRGKTPINSVRRISGRWTRGVSNIKITGKFGEEIPDPIKLVATKLVGISLDSRSNENKKSESIEGYSVTYQDFDTIRQNDWSIDQILQLYTRIQL